MGITKYSKHIYIGHKTYVLEYWREKDYYMGRLIDRPEISTQGNTMKWLEENIYSMCIKVDKEVNHNSIVI